MLILVLALFGQIAKAEGTASPPDEPDRSYEVLAGKVLDEQIAIRAPLETAPATLDEPATASASKGRSPSLLSAARELLSAGKPFEAAAALGRFDHATKADAGEWLRLSVEALLACGLPARALEVVNGIHESDRRREVQGLRLDIAEWYLLRDDTGSAAKSLPDDGLTDVQTRLRKANVEAKILLARQHPADAVAELLEALDRNPIELLALDRSSDLSIHYLRYNLAVGLIRAGDTVRGRSLLDRLGRIKADTPEARALRDRANLSLGDALLRERQGATAREMYLRVQSVGPFADRALLGLGWASLAESGQRQLRLETSKTENAAYRDTPDFVLKALRRRNLIECRDYNLQPHAASAICTDAGELARSDAGSDENQRRRLALIPWQFLLEQDPDDPAAREASLAIPMVLAQLGDRAEALAHYQLAVDRLASDQAGLQGAVEALRASALPAPEAGAVGLASRSDLDALPDGIDPQSRLVLRDNRTFMHQWSAAAGAARLANMAVDEDLRSSLSLLTERYRLAASRTAIEALEREDGLLRRYREAALKGLLRLQDPS